MPLNVLIGLATYCTLVIIEHRETGPYESHSYAQKFLGA